MIICDLRFQTVSLSCMIMLCNQNFQAYYKIKTLALICLKSHHERKGRLSQFIFNWIDDYGLSQLDHKWVSKIVPDL